MEEQAGVKTDCRLFISVASAAKEKVDWVVGMGGCALRLCDVVMGGASEGYSSSLVVLSIVLPEALSTQIFFEITASYTPRKFNFV